MSVSPVWRKCVRMSLSPYFRLASPNLPSTALRSAESHRATRFCSACSVFDALPSRGDASRSRENCQTPTRQGWNHHARHPGKDVRLSRLEPTIRPTLRGWIWTIGVCHRRIKRHPPHPPPARHISLEPRRDDAATPTGTRCTTRATVPRHPHRAR